MITGIAIENFKGIGDRIEIPIKPLTFLLSLRTRRDLGE